MSARSGLSGDAAIAGHLATIDLLIDEHRAVLYGLKLAGDRVSDLEALFNLQNVYSEWTQSSVESLAEKQKSLCKLIDSLYDGARQHFHFEEENLRPLLGEATLLALSRIHRRIQRQFRRTKEIALACTDRTDPQELLSHKTRIEKAVYDLCQVIDQHRSQEEILLHVLKAMLEVAKSKQRRTR